MKIGGILHETRQNGREMAQITGRARPALEWGESVDSILLAGETIIPVSSVEHLFRTPSLGGQTDCISTVLPAIFHPAPGSLDHAHSSAHFPTFPETALLTAPAVASLGAKSSDPLKGEAECGYHVSGWHWPLQAVWQLAAKRWANRPSLAPRSARAQRQCWMATCWQVRPSGRQATFCIARKTPANADVTQGSLSGRHASERLIRMSRAARGPLPARGFSCASLSKKKDVPCSIRS